MNKKAVCKIVDKQKDYIIRELETGRDIGAILGSIGFNFQDDCEIAYKYIQQLNLI